MTSLIEHELEHFIVSETPGVERCVVNEKLTDEGKKYILQTQGINLEALVRHSDVLDVNTLYSNDLNLIMCHYGIEACARALVKEIIRVFTPYGIDVNRRHLTLTADYMTFTGAVLPFSRGAMSSSASPLQRMTFETTVGFMREALVHGESDFLSSPSARLVVGGLLNSGTSIFDLLVPNSYSLGRSWNGGNSLVS
ncbi:hypothetical protein AB6A40_010020 [Gnathostoma spinigerum]|uniref:DNA-directed RNA polymerase n=1 Tax=Gnathostoma spinigerum TaxID=75299 RepID=A0ABD6EVD6_9BILA